MQSNCDLEGGTTLTLDGLVNPKLLSLLLYYSRA